MEIKVEDITKAEVQAYEGVRQSGFTNMYDVRNVIEYAYDDYDVELTKDKIAVIIHNYGDLIKKFDIARD